MIQKTRVLFAVCMLVGTVAAAGEVADSAAEIKPLKVGDMAPVMTLLDASGTKVQMGELYAQKPTVVIAYRGGWCPFCTRQLESVGKAEQTLRDRGYQLVAVSLDKPKKISTPDKPIGGPDRLLSDPSLEYAQALGVAYRLDAFTAARYDSKAKIDLTDAMGKNRPTLPVPAVFIVGTDGKIAFSHANPNYRERVTTEALLKAAK
jgi:peroxiredoxin